MHDEGFAITLFVIVDANSEDSVISDSLLALNAILQPEINVKLVVVAPDELDAGKALVTATYSPIVCIGTCHVRDVSQMNAAPRFASIVPDEAFASPAGVTVVNLAIVDLQALQDVDQSKHRRDALRLTIENGTSWASVAFEPPQWSERDSASKYAAALKRDVVDCVVDAVAVPRSVIVLSGDVPGAGATTAAMASAVELVARGRLVLYVEGHAEVEDVRTIASSSGAEGVVIILDRAEAFQADFMDDWDEDVKSKTSVLLVAGPSTPHEEFSVAMVPLSSRLSKREYKAFCSLLKVGYPGQTADIDRQKGEWQSQEWTAEMFVFILAAVHKFVPSIHQLVKGLYQHEDADGKSSLATVALADVYVSGALGSTERPELEVYLLGSRGFKDLDQADKDRHYEALVDRNSDEAQSSGSGPPPLKVRRLVLKKRCTRRLLRRSSWGFTFLHHSLAILVLKEYGMPLFGYTSSGMSSSVTIPPQVGPDAAPPLVDVEVTAEVIKGIFTFLGVDPAGLAVPLASALVRSDPSVKGVGVFPLAHALFRGGVARAAVLDFAKELLSIIRYLDDDPTTVAALVMNSKINRRAGKPRAITFAREAVALCQASTCAEARAKEVMCQNAVCEALLKMKADADALVAARDHLLSLDPVRGDMTKRIVERVSKRLGTL